MPALSAADMVSAFVWFQGEFTFLFLQRSTAEYDFF